MPKFPFGLWLPDLPSLGNPGALVVNNVIPTRGGYRPLSSLETASTALSARCQGLVAVRDISGNVNIVAGSDAKLELLSSASTAWGDVSLSGGYSTATDEQWDFAFDGSDTLVGVNGPTSGDLPQTYELGTSTAFADLSADAPSGRSCAWVKNALMIVNTNDGTNGHRPNAVRWSKRGDASTWPTPGSSDAIADESDMRFLNGNYGDCMMIRAGLPGADALIWQERALWRVNYVGGDVFYQFDLIEGAKGTISQGSVVPFPGGYAYLAEDGWYATDGQSVRAIGTASGPNGPIAAIDKAFFADVDQASYPRISGLPDPINKVIVWSYPANGNQGVPNRLLMWNWDTGGWAMSDGIGDHEILVTTMSVGFSLDSLDAIYPSLDAMTVSLDSRTLTGGRVLLGAVNTSHEIATLTGQTLAAQIDTSEQQPIDGGRAFVSAMWPLIEGTDVTPTLAPITRNRQSDAPTVGAAVTMNDVGCCPMRVDARYLRARAGIPAGSTWSFAVGVEVPARAIRASGYR